MIPELFRLKLLFAGLCTGKGFMTTSRQIYLQKEVERKPTKSSVFQTNTDLPVMIPELFGLEEAVKAGSYENDLTVISPELFGLMKYPVIKWQSY